MLRLSAVLRILVVVVAAFFLYMVKYQVQAVKNETAETARQLEQEKEALHVVAAEWAYLNRPQRLAALAAKYLATSDLTVNQVADIEAIPFPGQSQAAIDPEEGIRPVAAESP